MQVVIISNERSKKELLAYPVSGDLTLHWIEEPGQYAGDYTEDACIDLLFYNDRNRVEWLLGFEPALIVINAVLHPLETINERFVRINGWHSFLKRSVVEAACKNESLKQAAGHLFSSLGRTTEWTPDIPGFITPRVIAAVINEAFMALEEKVSDEKEIDTAMKLGTNYPYGPFEWAEQIGYKHVYELLETLQKEQSRYTPSLLLQQKALESWR